MKTRKPRVIWVNDYEDLKPTATLYGDHWPTEKEAKHDAMQFPSHKAKQIKFVEVMEE